MADAVVLVGVPRIEQVGLVDGVERDVGIDVLARVAVGAVGRGLQPHRLCRRSRSSMTWAPPYSMSPSSRSSVAPM